MTDYSHSLSDIVFTSIILLVGSIGLLIMILSLIFKGHIDCV